MIATAEETKVQCPFESCGGRLEQGRWDLQPRCDTCLRSFDIVEADQSIPAKEGLSLKEQVKELQGKLDDIASIASW